MANETNPKPPSDARARFDEDQFTGLMKVAIQGRASQAALESMLDNMAKARGFSNWMEAHNDSRR